MIQLAVNYCIRKAVGSLRYTVSVSTGAGIQMCLSRSRQLCLSRSADNNAITVIPSSLSDPLRNNQPVFFAAGTRKLPVPYPYTEKVYLIDDQIDAHGVYVILGVQKRAFNR